MIQRVCLITVSIFLLAGVALAQQVNSDVENQGLACNVSAKNLLSPTDSKLPDPFLKHSGTRIADQSEWACKRNEVIANLAKYEIGPKPSPETSTVTATYSGNKLTVTVKTSSGSIDLTSNVSGSGSCVSIGMNGNASNISGCKSFAFAHDQVVRYATNDTRNQSDPFYKVYPDLWGKVSNYAAWSWGISRLIDGIVLLKDQLGIDPTKIGIQGCSYAGKMALFGGALDERVTLTIVQESGGGGVNAWRLSKAFTARTGENIEKIDNTNYSWFLPSMRSLNPDALPHDHHQLLALIAPRAVIVLGNPEQIWLGDESGFISTIAARKVWDAFGVVDRIGYDFAGGHSHCAASSTQNTNVTKFVNKFLKGGNDDTKISANPPKGNGKQTFQIDTSWAWAPLPKLTGTYGAGGCDGFNVKVDVSPVAGGVVTMNPSDNCHQSGDKVTLTVKTNEGWIFDGWKGDASGSELSTVLNIDKNKVVTALFKIDGCPEYTPNLCGGAAFGDIADNTNEMPGSGSCVFIKDFTQIEPSENSTVVINGSNKKVCTKGWLADGTGDCGPVDKPSQKIDGGYYVYVEKGSINSYTPSGASDANGWKGIVKGVRVIPACDPNKIAPAVHLAQIKIKSLSQNKILINSDEVGPLEIYSLSGTKILQVNLIQGEQILTIQVPKGVYYAKTKHSPSIRFAIK